MKKYITIAALLAAGTAFANAGTTTFTDLSVDTTIGDITFDAEAGSFTGAGTWEAGGNNRAHTGLSFVLNLTEAKKGGANTVLVNFDTSADIGLYLTTAGIVSKWQNDTWNTSTSYSILEGLDSAWTAENGNTYIALTVTIADTQGVQGGLQLYSGDSADSLLLDSRPESATFGSSMNGLGASANTSLDAIVVNTSYIVSAAITPGWVPGSTAKTLSANLETTAKTIYKPIPEPSAFGMLAGLGALALVASRRRRK